MAFKVSVFLLSLLLSTGSVTAQQKPFDSKRDPERDLIAAKAEAKRDHKNIFLDFGGNWCGPCLLLDDALSQDPDVADTLKRNFVIVHVAVGIFHSGDKVKELREHLPAFNRYPHVIILAPDGTVLHDELKGDFITNPDGKGISHKVLKSFLEEWSPGVPRLRIPDTTQGKEQPYP